MTYEELNEVRSLKQKITKSKTKIKALEELIRPSSVKYTRGYAYDDKGKLLESYTCLDVQPKGTNTASPTEILAVMLTDEKNKLATLQTRLVEVIPKLTKKIQSEVEGNLEQTLMIYRYVACEYFRDIGFKMGYSEQWVYWKHNHILKKIRVD